MFRAVEAIFRFPFSILHLNDGDGLENSVDPDPLAPGNDAHGTNAEWYDLVCSDVFSKNGQADSLSISLPSGESVFFTPNVNTNAYYFVDVVAQKGPAPIRFNSSHLGRLGSPVVVALAGETNRVPLLIGATYSVTSDVPFTVSCPTNGFAEVSWFDGLNATVRWPMDFTFTENFTPSGRTMTIDVGPFDPGGVFEWGSASGGLVGGGVPSTGMDVCNCIQGSGNVAVVGCSSDCSCGGHCQVVGGYRVETVLFPFVCTCCTCGWMNAPAVENVEGPVLPTWRVKVPASSRLVYQITYVGRNESRRFEDIAVLATLKTNGEGQTKFDEAKATCCSVRFTVPAGDPVSTPESEGVIGRNEFTYDDATSSLPMNLRVSVMPSLDMVTASHMLGQFVLPSIEGVTILWDDGGSGNVSAQSFDSPFGLDGEDERLTLFSTRAVYQGYPLHNSGFGRKTVSFTCRGMTISQDFEIFFPKMGHNHPTCSTCPNCPNWFYYWREGDVCHIPSDAVWAEATGAHLGALGWLDASGVLFLTNLAADDEEQLRVSADYEMTNIVFSVEQEEVAPGSELFVTANSTGRPGVRYFVETTKTIEQIHVQGVLLGGLGRGIGCVAATVTHELTHRLLRERLRQHQQILIDWSDEYESLVERYGIDSLEYADYERRIKMIVYENDDSDGDRVVDEPERNGYLGLRSNVNTRDTYGLGVIFGYNGYQSYGDNEARYRLVEAERLSEHYHVDRDWSDPGSQHKTPYGPLHPPRDDSEGE